MSPEDVLEDARYPFEVWIEDMGVYVHRQSPLCLLHREIGGAVGAPEMLYSSMFGTITAMGREAWIAATIESCKDMVRAESRRRGHCEKCEWWRHSMATGESILERCIQSQSSKR